MKLSEIRGKDKRELLLDIQALEKEIFTMRFRAASEEIAKTARFREIRRTIARIKTIIHEREAVARQTDQHQKVEAAANKD